MPVSKYRTVEEMPRVGRVGDESLIPRIRAVWKRSFLLASPSYRRGVQRFRTMEEANAARERVVRQRLRGS